MTSTTNGQPMDRGWSWVICFASFLCYFLIGMSGQALSVLFLELTIKFHASLTVTSLSIMIQILFLSISSMVSVSLLIPKFGERIVTVISGVVFAGCSVGCAVSPNIAVFIVFCAIQGLCFGAVLVPVIGILGFYFNKRRSLAMSISSSGLCVSTIVAPPFIRALMEAYGLQGTFLFLAGAELNMVVAGMLLRPISSYRTAGSIRQKLLSDTADTNGTVSSSGTQQNHQTSPQPDVTLNQAINSTSNRGSESQENSPDTPNGVTETHVEGQKYTFENQTSTDEGDGDVPKSSKRLIKERPVLKRFNSVVGGVEAAESAIDTNLLEKNVEQDVESSNGCGNCCCMKLLKEIFNPELFTQWAFLLFLVSTAPSATNQYLFQYIPTIAVYQGATKEEGATILTVCGCVDLVSRILSGLLADTKLLRSTQITAIAQICLGVICQFNQLFTDFTSLLVMGVLMGLFIGTRQALLPLMLLEIVGMGKMSRCLSLTAVVGTVSAAAHSPALSAVVQSTGSYAIVLYYVGAALIISAIGILLTPLMSRLDAKRGERTLKAKRTVHT